MAKGNRDDALPARGSSVQPGPLLCWVKPAREAAAFTERLGAGALDAVFAT